jgi:hypothetical protein
MRRIFQATVWAPGGVPAASYRFRGIFRWVLPLTDILFLWFGYVGFLLTVSSVEQEAGREWQDMWSAGLALSALFCFIGIAFPKLWPVELIAKMFLIGHVLFYVSLQLSRILDPEVSAFSGLILILVLTPIWRFTDLSANNLRPWLRNRYIKRDRDVRDGE